MSRRYTMWLSPTEQENAQTDMKREIKTIKTPIGDAVIIKFTNDAGASVTLSSLGAGILSVVVPDREGKLGEVALGYADPASYFDDGPCMGKIPGRYANRIARGLFFLNGKEYQLAVNNGPNALHGGPTGFQNRIWQVSMLPTGVRFTYTSADGEENYPGNLAVNADYHWNDHNILELHITGWTDAPTPVNLTNHCYWNLRGKGSVLDHRLRLRASRFLVTDDTLIPAGELAEVIGTPMDFLEPRRLGERIHEKFPALEYGKGYDSCWALDGWKKTWFIHDAAVLEDEESGRVLTVGTTQPGVQIYTGNWLKGSPASRDGKPYEDYDGVAIEMQAFPDSPNHPDFPNTILRPGERYDERIRFAFIVK